MTRAGLPRFFDLVVAGSALLASLPLLALAALSIKLESPGPVFFRQLRIGRGGRPFTLVKLRTMTFRPEPTGTAITVQGDRRITRVGRWLRRTKLDEIPQLWNVVRGEMALVGPRPEVASWVDLADPQWQRILEALPGLTDPVTLRLRDEESLLGQAQGDHERFYRELLQPWKLRGYLDYLETRSPWRDLEVLAATFWAVARPASAKAPTLLELRAGDRVSPSEDI